MPSLYQPKLRKLRTMLRIADCPFAAQIRSAMTAYLPMWPWEYGAAQLYQESQWIPTAVSPTGYKGIAQFGNDTWVEWCDRLHFPADASPFDPTFAIPAYAAYMAWLRNEWAHVPRSEDERRKLAQASYNAGLGRLLAAQKWLQANGGNYNDALSIIAALHHVADEATANQAADYVTKIAKWYGDLSTSSNGATIK